MPNRRMIHASIWQDEDIAGLTDRQQLLFIGLFSNADDQGRLKGHPMLIKSLVFPYRDISSEDMLADLGAITAAAAVLQYQIDGKAYIQLTQWWEYQQLQWAKPSSLPASDGWADRIRVRKGKGVWVQGWPGTPDHNPYPTPVRTPKKTPVETGGAITELNLTELNVVESNSRDDDGNQLLKLGTAWAAARGGLVNPLDGEELCALRDEYTYMWVYDAIIEANNARSRGRNISMNFVKSILARWHQEGKDTPYDYQAKASEAIQDEAQELDRRKLAEWEAANLPIGDDHEQKKCATR